MASTKTQDVVSSNLPKSQNAFWFFLLLIIVVTIFIINGKAAVVASEEKVEWKHSFQYKCVPEANSCNASETKACPSEPKIFLNSNMHSENDHEMAHLFLLAELETGEAIRVGHDGIIFLSCQGSRPVTWHFKGRTNVSASINAMDINRETLDPHDSTTFCYTACINITVPKPKKFAGAGLYTCSYLGSVKEKKSIYIYGNDNSPNFVARLDGSNLIKTKSFSMDKVLVPCLGNSPNMNITLTKKNSKGEYGHLDASKIEVEYSAKNGATITKKIPNDRTIDLLGTYKCQTNNRGDSRNNGGSVKVEVEFMEKKPEQSSEFSIIVDNGKCKRFICSSKLKSHSVFGNKTDGNKLDLFVIKCGNPIHCQFSLGFLEDGIEPLDQIHGEAVTDACDYKTNSTWSTDYETISIKIKEDYKAGVVVCRTRDKTKYQYIQFIRDVVPELTGKAIILISNNEFKVYINRRLSPEGASFTVNSSLVISQPNNARMFLNKQHQIVCETSSFLFANGIQWLVRFLDGSLSSDPTILETEEQFNSEDHRNLITTEVNVTTKNISAFICLAPWWNSDEWTSSIINVTVLDAVLPRFVSTSEKTKRFFDTEEDVTLECEATGLPEPTISWYKDNQPFLDSTNNSLSIKSSPRPDYVKSILHFNLSKNIDGTYVCNATNIMGTVEYPITIKVASVWLYSVLGVLILSVMILGLCLLIYWRKARSQERYIHQLTKQDIDEFVLGTGRWKIALVGGSTTSVCNANEGLSDYANISGGINSALYIPFDKKKYGILEKELFVDWKNDEMKLGDGHFAKVYRGTFLRPRPNVVVAVKTLKDPDGDGKLFLREIKILAYIGKHDHVVTLIGAVINFKGGLYMVMEYCAEGSLKSLLLRKRPMFLDETADDDAVDYLQPICIRRITTFDLIRWSYQFALGMEYIASLKIIHGDLAARNLLITENSQLKISDLGLAKKLKSYQRTYTPTGNTPQADITNAKITTFKK